MNSVGAWERALNGFAVVAAVAGIGFGSSVMAQDEAADEGVLDILTLPEEQAEPVPVREEVVEEAAPAPAAAVEEIVVTGSRIVRSDLSSISPITVLSSEDLAAAGNPTLEDFLQDLPSTLGGADFGSSVNNGNPGLATAQLRGLGPNRTLVLINGHRPAQAGTDGIVDLNMIPTAIIERIELLRDGASTVYGSDAIAGVINIITKKDFEGLSLDLGYDVTARNDGETKNLALTWGMPFEGGNFVVSGQVSQRDPIYQRDRGFSACPLFDGPDGPICGGSGTAYPAQIIPEAESDTFVVDQTNGEVRPFDSAIDAYNYAAASLMVTPQDVVSLYAASNYEILPSSRFGSVESFFEAGYSNRESFQLLAPVGTFWAPAVPASNDFNPFGDAQCAGNPNCSAPQTAFIARRLAESTGRSFLQDAIAWRLVGGLRGELNNGWTWDFSYNYSDWTDAQRDGGAALQPQITGLVDPNCEVNSVCTPLPAGIQPWDPFNRDTLSAEQLAYGTVSINTVDRARMQITQFNLSGDFFGLELPGGAPAWALGFEHRAEKAASLPDGGAAIGAVFFRPGNVTAGAYKVDELYGELSLPILSGVTMAESLTFETSFRMSDYDFVDDVETTFKFALDWAPIADVRVRATRADGFRGANLSERFLAPQKTAASYSDPCNNWDTSGDQVLIDNCGPNGDNLPAGFTADAPQATTLEGGTPDLEPEQSESTTVGLVFTPEFLPGLSITIDWFRIELTDAIGTAGTGNVINRCYNSAGFSDPLCALIAGPSAVGEGPSNTAPDRRNAQNQVTGILLTNQNLSSFETQGIDFQIDYGFDVGIGTLDLRIMGAIIDKYNYKAVIGGETEQLAGKFGIDPYNKNAVTAFPDLALNTSLSLNVDNWGASLTHRWFDETLDGFAGNECGLVCTAGAGNYFDIQGYYDLNNMSFTFGIRNLTDEEPPYVSNYDDMNTLHYTYDTAGSYYYARAGFKF